MISKDKTPIVLQIYFIKYCPIKFDYNKVVRVSERSKKKLN